MRPNQEKGIIFIIGGILSIVFIPLVLNLIGLYVLSHYLRAYYLIYIIALVLVGFGIKNLICRDVGGSSDEESSLEEKENIQERPNQLNKIVNVTLVGGIIGLIGVRPNNALDKRIKKENANGWKVVQIIPSSSGNIFLFIFRFILLILTLFLYTTTDGYYIIMEKIENE